MAKKQTMDHAQLLVLSLLAGEDMYGYQMIVELARRSDHTFEMKEGTLYPVLHGLERDGAVEAYQQEAPTGRMRKYYRLTRRGAAVLREEAAAWQTYSGAVNAVLWARPGLDTAGYGQAGLFGLGALGPERCDGEGAGGHSVGAGRPHRGPHGGPAGAGV